MEGEKLEFRFLGNMTGRLMMTVMTGRDLHCMHSILSQVVSPTLGK